MSAPRTIQARAYRDDDGWWTIKIPELVSPGPGDRDIVATTAATSFRSIGKAAHELAAAWLDIDDAAISVNVEIEIPDSIAQMWREGTEAEIDAREAQARAVEKRRGAVRALRESGYPAEAAAAALGISRQRIGQLEKTPAAAAKIAS